MRSYILRKRVAQFIVDGFGDPFLQQFVGCVSVSLAQG